MDSINEREMTLDEAFAGRHPSVAHFEKAFQFGHLPEPLATVSWNFAKMAIRLLGLLKDGPELAACLRKLREAKDCAVLQAVIDLGE